MIAALLLALGDLGDRRILGVLFHSLLVTLALFVALGAVLMWLLAGADPCGWVGLDGCPLDPTTGGVGALVLTLAALWLLFPAVAIGVVSAYGDGIVAAVEAKHYPAAAGSARRLGLAGGALLGVRSSLRVLLYNLLAMPFYLVLLVTGVGTVVLLVAVNGLALGRDLGLLVATRQGSPLQRQAWLRASRLDRSLLGVAVTALFLVPFANLVAPVVGAAAMTHLNHRRRTGTDLVPR